MMIIKSSKLLTICLIFMLSQACNKPKVIKSESAKATISANSLPALEEINGENKPVKSVQKIATKTEHKVEVKEVLNTEKYTYMNVLEGQQKFWIAIPKSDVVVGETYYYSGGLLKRNFYSREFDRVFDKVYLVSKIWKNTKEVGHTHDTKGQTALTKSKVGASLNVKVGKVKPVEGAITIKELFKNKEKYKGKKVKITGKCMKINPKIMNRNWVHLQDGSGEALDLTVTTQEEMRLGSVLTLEGVISLNKDFGAGYHYNLIMEDATTVGL